MRRICDSNTSIECLAKEAGGKATNLGRLTQKGFVVPTWFSVTAQAFDEFVHHNHLSTLLRACLKSGEGHPDRVFPLLEEKEKSSLPSVDELAKQALSENLELAAFSKKVEDAFLEAKIPDSLEQDIKSALQAYSLESAFVAVRSSGIDEDSAENSFAGQFSSYLFQKGWEQISDSLKRCWASGYSERALAYRLERGLSLHDIRVGVVIQKMVNADSAGVVFSRHPIKMLDRDLVLVSSVWGLGEGLVSGELDSDDFEVHRRKGIVKKSIPDKSFAMKQAPQGGLVKVALEDSQKKQGSLTDEQVLQVSNLAITLEDSLGSPQDAEWCFENGRLFLVQTRPITNIPPNAFFDEHINGTTATLWDNSNIIESYSGVTTPLTFSFANRAYTQVYIQFSDLVGVPKSLVEAHGQTFRNMLGLLRGRIYYNLINWYKFVMMLPGSANNRGFMDTMMGVKAQVKPGMEHLFDFVKDVHKYSAWSRLILLSKTLWRFLCINSIVTDFHQRFNRVYESVRKKDLNAMSLPQLADHFEYLDQEWLKNWKAPIVNDYLCMLFFGLLKKLTENWVATKDTAASLQNDLLCGEGGLDSTEPTKFLMRIAEFVDKGEVSVRERMLTFSADAMWAEIKKEPSKELSKLFFEFLDRFGFRCVNELKLEEPDLHDDPTFVISAVTSYVRTKSYVITDMEERERAIRQAAEVTVKQKLSGPKLWIYMWVLKQARKAVKNRENLRFARTKVFGVSRHLFRAIGRKLVALKLLEIEQDIFYLTVEEILAFIEGRALSSNLKSVVKLRKVEFADYRDTASPPDRLITLGAAGASLAYSPLLAAGDLLAGMEDENADPNVLKGTPCCPGIVEGVVRVVHSLKDAEGINGEILVTGRTDPGWVPLYPSCSGLLIERGSLLSHSAVVARELGLPTIVGVNGGLMTKLKTGQKVRVDAGRGEIRILG